jgi:hypothetical protein
MAVTSDHHTARLALQNVSDRAPITRYPPHDATLRVPAGPGLTARWPL